MTKILDSQIFGAKEVEIAVIGGGPAGIEAANYLANQGGKVLIITSNLDTAGQIGFSGAIREQEYQILINQPRSLFSQALAKSAYNFRKNGERLVLIDKQKLQLLSKSALERTDNCYLFQDTVETIKVAQNYYEMKTRWGLKISAKKVVIACGTFIGSEIILGKKKLPGGRLGEVGSVKIKKALEALGCKLKPKTIIYSAVIKVEKELSSKTGEFSKHLIPEGPNSNLFYISEFGEPLYNLTVTKQEKKLQESLTAKIKVVTPSYAIKYWVGLENKHQQLTFVGRAAGMESILDIIKSVHEQL